MGQSVNIQSQTNQARNSILKKPSKTSTSGLQLDCLVSAADTEVEMIFLEWNKTLSLVTFGHIMLRELMDDIVST